MLDACSTSNLRNSRITRPRVQVSSGSVQHLNHPVVPNYFDVMGMLLAPLIGQDGLSMLLEAGLQLLQSADKHFKVKLVLDLVLQFQRTHSQLESYPPSPLWMRVHAPVRHQEPH